MLGAVWSGLGGKTVDRWAAPALVFWIGGIFAWVWGHGGFHGPDGGWVALGRALREQFGQATAVVQAMGAVLALLMVLGSAQVAQASVFGVLRVLEGYWPLWAGPIRRALTASQSRRIDRVAEQWRDLARRRADLTVDERVRYALLNARRASDPPDPADRMPTRLGNMLKASESRPNHRYGLDAAVCWPRLWLTMPDHARAELSAARARLDMGAVLWLWSFLFVGWTVFAWWSLFVGVAGMLIGYRLCLAAASQYGQLVQASFDLYRKDLYEALGRDFPARADREREAGLALTAFLERGLTPVPRGVAGRRRS
jgi:hypothetical protein